MKDTDFIDASTYLRVQEKRLLDSGSLERIADAGSPQEVLRMLSQNSDYDFSSLQSPGDYEQILKDELNRVYALAYSLTKEPAVVEVPAAKYDFHNLKTALKASYFPQRSQEPYFRNTAVDPDGIIALVEKGAEKSELPAHLIEAYQTAWRAYEKEENPQIIDLALDREMYRHMLALCGGMGNEFITGYVRQSIDFTNLKTLLRVKNMQRGTAFLSECLIQGGRTDPGYFVEHYNKTPSAMAPVFYYRHFGDAMGRGIEQYERTGNFSGLERLLDNLLVQYTRQVKYLAYGAEILFAYLVSKENEIRQIRILMACKTNGIQSDVLKERLRENYA